MTNRDLMTKWKELRIKFNSEKKPIPMLEMFLVCVGETEIDVQGKKEIVVGFYQGFDEKGSPTAMFSTDQKNRCFAYGLDTKKNTHVKAKIGKFVKLK